MASDEVFLRLRAIIVEQFGKAPEQVTRDTTLRGGLMLDSLDLMDLAAYIQRSFGVDADGQALRDAHTLAGLARWVRERRQVAA
ncbi:MAG: acyl carrier protein [Myxococcales bacterium]|nr:acyl carrier protein [Myxococcales bacterium]